MSGFKIFFCIITFMFFSTSLYAESVFLKDGSIVEGKITKDDDDSLVLVASDHSRKTISRRDVLRVLYNDNYKNRQYLYLTDGSILHVYVVNEDNDTYTYREDLGSPHEVAVRKNKVNGILKARVETASGNNSATLSIGDMGNGKTGTIIIKRRFAYSSWLVSYDVILDGHVIGKVSSFKDARFSVPRGKHELFIQQDFFFGSFKSNIVKFMMNNESIEFECDRQKNFIEEGCLGWYFWFATPEKIIVLKEI